MHCEHLVDVETGEVTEFYHLELETVKEQITREMGHKPVDHRLELFGCKLKSCRLSAKSLRHKIAAHRRLVAFCLRRSFGLCSPQKGPVDLWAVKILLLGKYRDKRHPQYLFLRRVKGCQD